MGKRAEKKVKKQQNKVTISNFKSRMVTVTDDWSPCYPDNQIYVYLRIICHGICKEPYHIQISAWGMYNTGVTMDRFANTREEAERIYQEIEDIYNSIEDGIDKDWFLSNGFKWA